MLPSLPTLITALLWLAAGIASLCTWLGLLSALDWKLELFSHFRVQYALLLTVCAAGFLLQGHMAGFLLSLVFLVLNLWLILPIYRRRASHKASGRTYRLFFANILGTNTNYPKLFMAMRNAGADVILLVEVRPNHLHALLPELTSYPYQFSQPSEDNFGLAIFSRLPLQSAEAVTFDEICTPTLATRLQLDGTSLTLLGIHPFPPKSRAQAARRDHQLAKTAAYIATQPGELLMAGDLNSTSWSSAFQRLVKASHLLDSRQGIGIQPSWPVNNPLLRIPIDHALHTPGITIHARRLGLPTGSDHFPLLLDFSIISRQDTPFADKITP